MDEKRELLRHTLAALAYRGTPALEGSVESKGPGLNRLRKKARFLEQILKDGPSGAKAR